MHGSLALLLLFTQPLRADFCLPHAPLRACEFLPASQAVFQGTIVERRELPKYYTAYRVQVNEIFKGLSPGTEQVFLIRFPPAMADSSWEGAYLFYITPAVRAPSTLKNYSIPWHWRSFVDQPVFHFVARCREILRVFDKNDPDLPYLRAFARGQLPNSGWLEGKAIQNEDLPTWGGNPIPVANGSVEARRGDQAFTASSSADGSFRIPNLIPGIYDLSAWHPALGKAQVWKKQVTIPESGCATAMASFQTGASISGTVLDSAGQPAPHVYLSLAALQPGGRVQRLPGYGTHSDQQGRFTISPAPLVPFLLGVNIGRPPSREAPFEAVYAPGTQLPSDARMFTLRSKEQFDSVIVHLPPPVAFGNLYVDVFWSDNKPATGAARATAEWHGYLVHEAGSPRSSNRVSLYVPLGRTYHITAGFNSDKRWVRRNKDGIDVALSESGRVITIRLKEPSQLYPRFGEPASRLSGAR